MDDKRLENKKLRIRRRPRAREGDRRDLRGFFGEPVAIYRGFKWASIEMLSLPDTRTNLSSI